MTLEVTGDVIDREVPGIAEAIRSAGLHKTPHAAATVSGVPQDCARVS